MGQIKVEADAAFRDYVTDGVPSSGPNDPDKAEIRGVFDTIDDKVGTLETTLTTGRKGFATYAALAASATPAAGAVAEVPPSDAGTHTDPVVGGTVANSGVYAYSTSPAGWERLFDYATLLYAVPTTVGGSGNAITMSPITGYAVSGTDQLFMGTAGSTNSAAFTVAITGINSGSATAVVMPNGETVPINILKANYPFIVRYNSTTSKFVLLHPSQPFASMCLCDQVSGPANAIVAQSKNAGTMIARTSLADTEFAVKVTGNASIGSKSLSIKDADGNTIIAATPVYEVDGTVPGAGVWGTGDTVRFRYSATLSGFVRQRGSDVPNAAGILANRMLRTRPLKTKPFALMRASNKRLLLATFVSGGARQDYAVHEFIDIGTGMGIATCLIYNGCVGYIDGLYEEFANFTGEDTGGGILDSLQPPEWEPVFTAGLHASYPTGFGPVGPGHGHLGAATTFTIVADGDSSVNYALLGNLPVGAIIRPATSLVITQVFPATLPDNSTPVGTLTYVHTAVTGGVAITGSLVVSGTGIGITSLYAAMASGRGDRVKPAGLNAIAATAEDDNTYGLSGGVKTENANLGEATSYQIFTNARNTHILEAVLNQAGGPVDVGAGYTWAENGSNNDAWLQDRAAGYAKVYVAGINKSASWSADGKTITWDTTYRVRSGALS